MEQPLAYLITWTCYGTWLHGDQRGSVDSTHNIAGSPLLSQNVQHQVAARGRMLGQSTFLRDAARKLVDGTIVKHCQWRRWTLHALNVRTNHVHVVVSAAGTKPEKVMSQLKAWCTRRLRDSGTVTPDQPLWTRHGSTRYLWDETSVAGAIRYVTQMQ